MPERETSVFVWDFTIPLQNASPDQIMDICRGHCKKWTFQSEKGEETGYEHFQGRVSLTKKQRLAGIKKIFTFDGAHFTPTSTCNKDNMFYVMKATTRLAGPWSNEDKETYIPRQYRGFMERLLPWQQTIWDQRDEFQPRTINIVFDPIGKQGKSTLASLFELHNAGIDVPPCNDGEKLVQSLCNILVNRKCREPKVLFVDMPRSMDQSKLYGMYTAIEQIKKGKVYDFRYSYTDWWFDAPQIWVFCNTEPHMGYVSRDRWKFWRIAESKLESYEP